MTKVIWLKKAAKQLISIDYKYQAVIKDKVSCIVNFPDVHLDIKKLQGTDSLYRIRIGDYRVIFEVVNDIPIIIYILEVQRRQSKTYNSFANNKKSPTKGYIHEPHSNYQK